MNLINTTLADSLQYVSFILESVGLTLAFIEIKSPSTANKIEQWIHDFQDHIHDLGRRITRKKHSQAVITIFFILLFFTVIPSLWGLFEIPGFLWVIFFFIGGIVLFIIGLHLLVDFIHSLDAFSGGKAIGSLGVCLTSLGLMGEIYQILCMIYCS